MPTDDTGSTTPDSSPVFPKFGNYLNGFFTNPNPSVNGTSHPMGNVAGQSSTQSTLQAARDNAFTLGGMLAAPFTGAVDEVGQQAARTGEEAGRALGNVAQYSLTGAGYGLQNFGEYGLNQGIGGGIGGAAEKIGTGVGKGVSNAAVGAIPAVAIAVLAVLAVGVAISVSGAKVAL
jgi:hypothetical protein